MQIEADYQITSSLTHNCYSWWKSDKLGQGAQGEVYRVTDQNGMVYACKVINPDTSQWSSYQISKHEERLQREITSLCKSNHINVAQYVDFVDCGDTKRRFLIQEYCDNSTLTSRVGNEGVPEQIALPWIIQLACGLQYIHNQNVIHRDIKPDNIMFHKDIPKFIDFGLSKYITEEKQTQDPQTVNVGTPRFMAPELLDMFGYYDYKVDIWALGMVYYNLLTGQYPWLVPETCGIQEMLNIIQDDEEIKFPHQKQISPKIQDVIRKMLKYDYETRISSNELVELLLK